MIFFEVEFLRIRRDVVVEVNDSRGIQGEKPNRGDKHGNEDFEREV